MPRWQQCERTRIHDPQALHAEHPRLRVHDSILISLLLSHPARAAGVEDCPEALAREREDLLVAPHTQSWTRKILVADGDVPHVCEDLARALVAGDDDGLVGGVGEPVGVYERRISHAGRGNGDVAAREGRRKRDGDGGVVVAICRAVAEEVLLVAVVSARGEKLDVRPARG